LAQNSALAKKESGMPAVPETTRGGIFFTPRVDIGENPDEVLLLCDMPGAKPDDIDVRFEQGELTLHGKVAQRRCAGEALFEEYGVGDFYRTFAIAPEIDSEKISAECRDGVLTVHLPKQANAKPRRITVQGG